MGSLEEVPQAKLWRALAAQLKRLDFNFFFFFNTAVLLSCSLQIFVPSCGIFFCGMRALQLWNTGSGTCELQKLRHGSLVALGACGILVPHPEIKLVSLALQGGFLTTGPPGKSSWTLILYSLVGL